MAELVADFEHVQPCQRRELPASRYALRGHAPAPLHLALLPVLLGRRGVLQQVSVACTIENKEWNNSTRAVFRGILKNLV